MRHVALSIALGLSAIYSVQLPKADGVEVSLTNANGEPVRWGSNTIPFGNPPQTGADFKAEMGANASLLAAGLYRIRSVNGVLSSPDPQVRVDKSRVQIDATLIDRSLRAVAGVAWSNRMLYVAEQHSNDCTDRYVYSINADSILGERYETVHRPAALAVSSHAMFVLGEDELAAFDLSTKRRLWTVRRKSGPAFHQIALLGDSLYVPDVESQKILVLSSKDGAPVSEIALPPTAAPTTPPKQGFFGPAIAATPGGTLIVSNGDTLAEYTHEGRRLKAIADIPRAFSVAVSATGEIAVAAQEDHGGFYVLKMSPSGQPLLKIMKTGWNDFGKETCDRRYFAGFLGKVLAVGGLAYDESGNLYVGDRNDVIKSGLEWRGGDKDMASDGGVVKLSPRGETLARLGSRLTDGSLIRARLDDRKKRAPLLRTKQFLDRGGREAIVVYGDSITQVGGDWNGGASSTQRNWTHLLGAMITERHARCTVNVAARGIGGNVAYNGLCRAPQPDLPDMDAALYLLEFGTNDLDRPWISPERYAAALRQFVQMLFVYTDSDVVLLTTGPILGEHPRKPATYHQVVLDVAREFNIPAVDIERAVNLALAGRPYPTLHLGDEPGRKMEDPHPNDAGHRVWAEATLNVLDPR